MIIKVENLCIKNNNREYLKIKRYIEKHNIKEEKLTGK